MDKRYKVKISREWVKSWWQTRKRDLLLEEGRLTYEGYWSWKRKLKLKWLQRGGGVTIEKKAASSNSSGIGGTRDPGGVREQKHSQCYRSLERAAGPTELPPALQPAGATFPSRAVMGRLSCGAIKTGGPQTLAKVKRGARHLPECWQAAYLPQADK